MTLFDQNISIDTHLLAVFNVSETVPLDAILARFAHRAQEGCSKNLKYSRQ